MVMQTVLRTPLSRGRHALGIEVWRYCRGIDVQLWRLMNVNRRLRLLFLSD